jgi:hypothetical protein
VSEFDETLRRLRKLKAGCEQRLKDMESGTRRIRVDKRTHRTRFEDETEEGVTIVIEKKEGGE